MLSVILLVSTFFPGKNWNIQKYPSKIHQDDRFFFIKILKRKIASSLPTGLHKTVILNCKSIPEVKHCAAI